jgi:2-oxoglutarate dehydrogenase E2 component (dihydrolipoamide succinyltransferase)
MIAIKVPPLGESIVEATVSRWLKQEGEAVTIGETLVELETDKITVEVPALKSGVLSARSKAEGDVVGVGDVLGQLDEAGVAGGAAMASADTDPPPMPKDPSDGPTPVPILMSAAGDPPPAPHDPSDGPTPVPVLMRSAPAARRAADDAGVDIAKIEGTGRGGAVNKTDVITAVAAGAKAAPAAAAAPSAPTPAPVRTGERETREKMTTRRKRIAENLLLAQHSTAHLTTFNEIDMSATTALRNRLKDKVEKEHGVKLSFMPFFVKAATMALKAYPLVNSQIDGDSIVYKHYVNMGIAVASDAGLVVPNVKDADQKGMLAISRDIAGLASKARAGKLAMDDLTGGTFTITNGGVFGSLISTPIINFPQVAILGLHKTQDRPVAIDGKVEIRPMMYVALSYDHRVIDGQQAVLFLVRIKELMEDPAAMLVD